MHAVGGWNRFKVKLSVADCPTDRHNSFLMSQGAGLLPERFICLKDWWASAHQCFVVLSRRLEIAERRSAACKRFEIIVMGMVHIWERVRSSLSSSQTSDEQL